MYKKVSIQYQLQYDPARYEDVLELVWEKSDWERQKQTKHLGVSAYFNHDTYVAHILYLVIKDG